MKIACICVGGQVRSVAMADYLISLGYNAVPLSGANPFIGNFLWYMGWADKVIVIGSDARDTVRNKMTVDYEFLDVFDTFGNPNHPELRDKIKEWFEQNKHKFV